MSKEYVFVGRAQLKTRDYIHQIENENRELCKEIERLNKEKKELKDGWQEEVYSKNEVLNDWFECKREINRLNNIIETTKIFVEKYNDKPFDIEVREMILKCLNDEVKGSDYDD